MRDLIAGVATLLVCLLCSQVTAEERLGTVHFLVSCSPTAQQEFNRGVALLHSFFYAAAVRSFTSVTTIDPGCAMGHWGVAMTHWYPLWYPPNEAALKAGTAAVDRAKAIGGKTQCERDYIAAIEQFYRDADKLTHTARALAYERAMEQVSQRYPDDREAAIFYALALQAAANPTDKTYAKQLKSAEILEKEFAEQPNHPGVAHYLIHAYDYPSLAHRALPAARRYSQIAPSVPHALHMPSHTFTLLGLWEESIRSNRTSEAATMALGREEQGPFHSLDYQVYAYLQLAQDAEAARAIERLRQLPNLNRTASQPHYALAAAPARYAVERKRWLDAALLEVLPSPFAYTEALTHFARALGASRSGDVARAKSDIQRLEALRDAMQARVPYWATQIEVQRRAAGAWVALAEKRTDDALKLMRSAADLEGTTDKNPVTPGAIVPARELLGDMLLQVGESAQALREFEASLKNEPNRFNGLAGAARAAALSGDRDKARAYYAKLLALTERGDTERSEVREAKAFLMK